MEILKVKSTHTKEYGFSFVRTKQRRYIVFKFGKTSWTLCL